MRVLFSFNKTGLEAEQWAVEIARASNDSATFVPFDHTPYLDVHRYLNAWELDRLYRTRAPELLKLYRDLEAKLGDERIDAIIVDHCPPYHPDFLRTLDVYRALYSGDDPDSTYRRNIPYLHAYHHVLFADPVYSPALDMQTKMRECGMVNADWCPIGVMDFERSPAESEAGVFEAARDIDIIYIGSFFRQKLALLADVKRAFGDRVRIHGYFKPKHNLYFMWTHRYPSFVRPVSFSDRTRLYGRAKIGFNIHWDEFGLGNQRLYMLPANGVMQISDCADHLHRVFEVGAEIEGYRTRDELLDKLSFYLAYPDKREAIARAGYRRVMKDYRFGRILGNLAGVIQAGMARIGWRRASR